MDSELSHKQVIEMLPAYALGALEADEMLAVDSYLEQHQELLPQLQLAEEAANQLAHAAPMTPLPTNAKARLMNRVRADLHPEPISEVATESSGQSWLRQLQNWFRPLNGWTVIAGAAAVALVVILLSTSQTRSQLDQLRTEVADLQTTVGQLEAVNNELQQTNQVLEQRLQTDQARLTFIANTTPQRTFQVPATDDSPIDNANGTLYVSSGDNEALLLLQGLQPLATDQTYQLWVAPDNDTTPTSVGLIELQPNDAEWFSVTLPLEADVVQVVGLSIEPAGGSPGPGPSGPVILHTP